MATLVACCRTPSRMRDLSATTPPHAAPIVYVGSDDGNDVSRRSMGRCWKLPLRRKYLSNSRSGARRIDISSDGSARNRSGPVAQTPEPATPSSRVSAVTTRRSGLFAPVKLFRAISRHLFEVIRRLPLQRLVPALPLGILAAARTRSTRAGWDGPAAQAAEPAPASGRERRCRRAATSLTTLKGSSPPTVSTA